MAGIAGVERIGKEEVMHGMLEQISYLGKITKNVARLKNCNTYCIK